MMLQRAMLDEDIAVRKMELEEHKLRKDGGYTDEEWEELRAKRARAEKRRKVVIEVSSDDESNKDSGSSGEDM